MAYATQSDIVELYGPDALFVADRDGDGVADTAAVTRALEGAQDEIDTYIAVRYRLPLAQPARILRQYAVDIALYRLALSADVLSDEHRRRYEDTIAALKRIAKGEAALVMPADDDAEDDGQGPRPIVVGGPERIFSREKMRGL
ncbi:gp436 family protein [Roseinatronobacter sp. NSM]|uniref:gp436 family protein n=1 Tax=Roseinatronobacter sp. NSM TaxID=3457785 RepID=UPI00403650A3